MAAVRSLNLLAKFLLELVAVAAFAYWGGTVGSGAVSVVVALGAPITACVLWGAFAAPRASHRLSMSARVPFELGVFALATVALAEATTTTAALVFAAAVVINAVLLTALGQWEA
jgi:hypothetical protein